MRTLVVGSNGQLGQDMMLRLRDSAWDVTGVDMPVIDLTRPTTVEGAIQSSQPKLIINCSAYTAVDACETNQEIAYAVNAEGVKTLAQAASRVNAAVVHISTDYVFDGTRTQPYEESDAPCPQSVYGKSKWEGERLLSEHLKRHFIFRTAWLYGNRGPNFVKTIRKLALDRQATGQALKVVNDQWGSPTYTMQLCDQIIAVLTHFPNEYGTYHCTGEGRCTWFDFATEIVASYGLTTPVLPCTTQEFPRPAPRPAFSILENGHLKRLGVNIMKEWKDAFALFREEEKAIERAAG